MTESIDIKTRLPTRVGLSSHAIFRLWKTALKDDETLLDEAIASMRADDLVGSGARRTGNEPDYSTPSRCQGGVQGHADGHQNAESASD
jgi:hypothetical protein